MGEPILILDLDGVLITTPIWRKDKLHEDGYSAFNFSCVKNLNSLFANFDCKIWLSSTRRTTKTLEEFNIIFQNRNIRKRIYGFLPVYPDCSNRKEEVERFVAEKGISKFIIIDDDKSLHDLDEELKKNLILTQFHKGFDEHSLNLALSKI